MVELFPSNEDTLFLDVMARGMAFSHRARTLFPEFDNNTQEFLGAYSDGVNAYMSTHWRPMELRLVGVTPEPWRPEDCMAVTSIMGYLGKREGTRATERE